jgi:two-component system, LuxR family, sensor kinase FixL
MPERKTQFLLILIMTSVSLCVGGIACLMLYRAAIEQTRNRLVETAQSQARLIEAVARFDSVNSSDFPDGSEAATLKQIIDAHENYRGFGETGEFTLAKKEGDQIVFLLSHRHYDLGNPQPVPFDSKLAEPMQAALSGRSSTMIGRDYRGEMVLAAHEPVAELNLGIVAKIDMSEVRAPFLRAAAFAGGATLFLVVLGSMLFLRVGKPMITLLQKQKSRIEGILKTAAEAIITINSDGIIESFNPAAERMFGHTAAEAIGRNVNMLMPTPFREEHDDYIARYLQTREPKIIGVGREVVGLRRNGSTFPVELNVSQVDHLGLFTGIMRDISERKQSEKELRQEHEFSDSIISTAHAIILVLDSEGRIVRTNPFFEEITGYAQDEVVGKDWCKTFSPERDRSRFREVFRAAVGGMRVEGKVNPIVTRDGRERDIAWWATVLSDADGQLTGVLSVGQDVTDLKQTQERLVQAERLSAVGEAMTGLTHESRNALARSQANLRRLSRRLKDQPELLDLIDAAQIAQEDVRLLFEEVRQYAAPLQINRELTDVGQLIRETWENLTPSHEGRNAQLRVDEMKRDLSCEVDRFSLRNAIRNILENALAACENPAIIDIAYADARIGSEDALQISFRDNGPGLSPDAAQRAFDTFFTTKTHGTGLGLAIVKRTVEAHGGGVAVGNGDGPGAEIIITLPRSRE